MKPIKVVIPFLMTLLIACEQDIQEPDLPELNGMTAIRIKNSSGFFYRDVIVNTGGGEHGYQTVIPSIPTDYKLFDFAYRYAYVELSIDGKKGVIQPIDFVGETKLESGYYTYEIDVIGSHDGKIRLSLTLIED